MAGGRRLEFLEEHDQAEKLDYQWHPSQERRLENLVGRGTKSRRLAPKLSIGPSPPPRRLLRAVVDSVVCTILG